MTHLALATLLLAQIHTLPLAHGWTRHFGVAWGAEVLHVATRWRT